MIEYVVKVYEGRKEWCLNGQFHREDGPAIEYPDGYKLWYLNGQRYYNKSNFIKALMKLKKMKLEELMGLYPSLWLD